MEKKKIIRGCLIIIFCWMLCLTIFKLGVIFCQRKNDGILLQQLNIIRKIKNDLNTATKENSSNKKQVENLTKEKDKLEEEKAELEEKVSQLLSFRTKRKYRLTSFWTNDGYGTSSCTGSGLCEKDFNVNEKGWYTYDGYLVLAAATVYGEFNTGYTNRKYFKYYDKVSIQIDGIDYKGIILDTCGTCSFSTLEERLDLFVSRANFSIDRGYKGRNPVYVSW